MEDFRIFGSTSLIIGYSLGEKNEGSQPYLDQLFGSVKSYFYPSNNGAHTSNLLNFVLKLCTVVVNRVSRERYHPQRQINKVIKSNKLKTFIFKVPQKMKLSDKQIENFVKSVLPCLEYAAFTKVKQELVPSIMRILAFLSPGIIIPSVLDLYVFLLKNYVLSS